MCPHPLREGAGEGGGGTRGKQVCPKCLVLCAWPFLLLRLQGFFFFKGVFEDMALPSKSQAGEWLCLIIKVFIENLREKLSAKGLAQRLEYANVT